MDLQQHRALNLQIRNLHITVPITILLHGLNLQEADIPSKDGLMQKAEESRYMEQMVNV